MPDTPNTVIGHVVDVQGSLLMATLVEDEQGHAPTITIGDEDVLVGQLGSYVAVKQNEIRLIVGTAAKAIRSSDHQESFVATLDVKASPGTRGFEIRGSVEEALPTLHSEGRVGLIGRDREPSVTVDEEDLASVVCPHGVRASVGGYLNARLRGRKRSHDDLVPT